VSANDEGEAEALTPVQRSLLSTAVELVGERLGPGGALALAPFTPWLENLASRVRSEFRSGAERRQAQVLGSANEATGQSPEEFAETIGKSDHTVLLTARAMAGAAGTAWPHKVYALGRALADGLIAEPDKVNVADLVIPAMIDMERPHLNLLDLLVRCEALKTGVESWEAVPRTEPPSNLGPHRWTLTEIIGARPALEPVMTSLIGTLDRHGLAVQDYRLAEAIENYSRANAEDIRQRTQRGGGGTPTVPAAPRKLSALTVLGGIVPEETWSPTPLGERVLGYYHQAAAETGASPAASAAPPP
jgi:hypothetical protein